MTFTVVGADRLFIRRQIAKGEDYEKIEFAFLEEVASDALMGDRDYPLHEVRDAVREAYEAELKNF